MATLSTLLDREGLPTSERLLIKIATCTWTDDREVLSDCVRRCRSEGMSRDLLEEVLLQAILFCGFPRAITAFGTLKEEWPTASPPLGGHLAPSQQREAGVGLFDAIYGKNCESIKELLRSYHSELHDFILDAAYGRILTRPGLETRIRELVAVGVLALADQIPQLIAHGRGALRLGASAQEVREAIFTAIEDDEKTEEMMLLIRRKPSGKGSGPGEGSSWK